MDVELASSNPELEIDMVGINVNGHEIGNSNITRDRDTPWLQDLDGDSNGRSDVWSDLWNVVQRDLVIVDSNNVAVGHYNLTNFDLADPANYAELREFIIDVAEQGTEFRADSFAVPMDETSDLHVLGNDNWLPEGYVIEEVSQPANGSVEIVSADVEGQSTSILRYSPNNGFAGTEEVLYTIANTSGTHRMVRATFDVMDAAPSWQNQNSPNDINNDGSVVPRDALLVINELNQQGARPLPSTLQAPNIPPPFLDPSGNNSLEARDALLIINELNAQSKSNSGGKDEAASGEGEADAFVVAPTPASDALSAISPATNPRLISAQRVLHPVAVDWVLTTRRDDSAESQLRKSGSAGDNEELDLELD